MAPLSPYIFKASELVCPVAQRVVLMVPIPPPLNSTRINDESFASSTYSPIFSFGAFENVFNCEKVDYEPIISDEGIWNLQESLLYYKHYGVEKKSIDHTGMMYLFRCINSTQKDKWNIYHDWILNQKD